MLEGTKQSIAAEYILTALREGEPDSSIKAKKNQPTLHNPREHRQQRGHQERHKCI